MEEMIQAACKSSLNSLGFSSHAYSGLPIELGEMKEENINPYFETIENLKEKYKDRIEIFAGFEYESRNAAHCIKIDKRCDYAIGSVHLFEKDKVLYSVDHSPEKFSQAEEVFGSKQKLCENYFEELLRFAKTTDFDIVGHFDLVTKFIETGKIEDFSKEKWYTDMSLYYLEQTAKTGKIFEVNTGAISRGWRSLPYPDFKLLKKLRELKVPVTVSSDAHSAQAISQSFDLAEKILREAGFSEVVRLTENGFVSVPL